MLLSEFLTDRYVSDSICIYLHTSVVASENFNEVAALIHAGKFSIYLFSSGNTELSNYSCFEEKRINENIRVLNNALGSQKVKISPYAEYDLTRYNKEIANLPKKKRLVIYGNKRAYVDFAVHCAEKTPIDVMLLVKVSGNYIIADSNRLRPLFVKNEYNAKWNPSVYSYGEKLQKGMVLYYGDNRTKFVLGENISALTGEGEVYRTSMNGCLCKIYKKGVLERGLTNKLGYVIKKKKHRDLAAWPLHIVYNKTGQPIGLLMRMVEGDSLANLIYSWNEDEWLKKACQAGVNICKTVSMLHMQNILVGDISPKDIIIDRRMNVTFIDADSFQYDEYPCPGMMYEYKYKDLDPRSLKIRLRPFFFEYFSLSVILYEMFMRGHYPNEIKHSIDEISFGDDGDADVFDYQKFKFPLKVNGHTDDATEASIRCWSKVPAEIQATFVDIFNYNRIVSPSEWQAILSQQLAGTNTPKRRLWFEKR